MGIMSSPALKSKSLWSYNPIPRGCLVYLPLWHESLVLPIFKSIDSYGVATTATATRGNAELVHNGTNQYLSFPDTNLPSGNADKTFLIWARTNTAANQSLFAYGTAASGKKTYLYIYLLGSGGQGANADTGGNYSLIAGNAGTNSNICDNVAYNDNVKRLYGVTTTGDTLTLFVNGAQTDTGASTQVMNVTLTGTAVIGAEVDFTFDLTGGTQEFWAYDRVLSTPEILYIYNKTRDRYE